MLSESLTDIIQLLKKDIKYNNIQILYQTKWTLTLYSTLHCLRFIQVMAWSSLSS